MLCPMGKTGAVNLNVTKVNNSAFVHCTKITAITLNNATEIGIHAFEGCTGLEKADIPNVTSIGEFAFLKCEKLNAVSVHQDLIMGMGAFGGCLGLTDIDFNGVSTKYAKVDGGLYEKPDEMELVMCFAGNEGHFKVRDRAGTIREHAFDHCGKLTSIWFPETIRHLPLKTFDGCVKLESIEMEDGNPMYESRGGILCIAGGGPFVYCPKGITSEITLLDAELPEFAFRDCKLLKKISLPNVKVLKKSTFNGCEKLEYASLPEVERIMRDAFLGCVSLKTVDSPNLTFLENGAFLGCHSLESIDISKVRKIGEDAFGRCHSLTSLKMNPNIESIGIDAFWDCTGLREINIDPGNPKYKSVGGVLYSKDGTRLMQYPAAKSSASFTIGAEVTKIDRNALHACVNLKQIMVDRENPTFKSVNGLLFTNDGEKLIRHPAGRTVDSYTLPAGKTVEYNAFRGCSISIVVLNENSFGRVLSLHQWKIGDLGFDTMVFHTDKEITVSNSVNVAGKTIVISKDTTNVSLTNGDGRVFQGMVSHAYEYDGNIWVNKGESPLANQDAPGNIGLTTVVIVAVAVVAVSVAVYFLFIRPKP